MIQFIKFWRMLYIVFEFFPTATWWFLFIVWFPFAFDRVTVSELHAHLTCPAPLPTLSDDETSLKTINYFSTKIFILAIVLCFSFSHPKLFPEENRPTDEWRRPKPENNQRQLDHMDQFPFPRTVNKKSKRGDSQHEIRTNLPVTHTHTHTIRLLNARGLIWERFRRRETESGHTKKYGRQLQQYQKKKGEKKGK